MDAPAIFTRLQTLGAVLSATPDGKVRVHVRKGLLTADDRCAIGEHRDELLATLTTRTPPPEADDNPPAWSRRAELRAAGDPHWQAPPPYRDLSEFVEAPARACLRCRHTGKAEWAIGERCAACPSRPQPKEARR